MFGAFASGVPSFGDVAWKAPVAAVRSSALPACTYAAGNLTANANGALPAIDGVTLAAGDRLLVAGQASSYQNGIYTVTSAGSGSSTWVLTRATDHDEAADMVAGVSVFVAGGTLYAGTVWTERAASTPTAGSPDWGSTYVTNNGTDTLIVAGRSGGGVGVEFLADLASDVSLFLINQTTGELCELTTNGIGRLELRDNGGGTATFASDGAMEIRGQVVPSIGVGAAGIQTGRQNVGANIAAGAARTDTITLPTAYADASYTILLTSRQGTITNGQCTMVVEGTPAAGSFQVNTRNNDTVARQPTIHWMTVHD